MPFSIVGTRVWLPLSEEDRVEAHRFVHGRRTYRLTLDPPAHFDHAAPRGHEATFCESIMSKQVLIIAALAGLTLVVPAAAQAPQPTGIKRTLLQKVDVPGAN